MEKASRRAWITESIEEHPAVKAWQEHGEWCILPRAVEILKEAKKNPHTKKCAVYRLYGAGPDGTDVVAKRGRSENIEREVFLYQDVLPSLSVESLRCFGAQRVDGQGRSKWIFLESADGPAFNKRRKRHRVLLTRWLGELHLWRGEREMESRVPRRGVTEYRRSLLRSQAHLMKFSTSRSAEEYGCQGLLKSLASRLQMLMQYWDGIRQLTDTLPNTVIHRDVREKNLSFLRPDIVCLFDWEYVAIGNPVVDLSAGDALIDSSTYLSLVAGPWELSDRLPFERLVWTGRVLRAIDAVEWALESLGVGWMPGVVSLLTSYERRTRELLSEVEGM